MHANLITASPAQLLAAARRLGISMQEVAPGLRPHRPTSVLNDIGSNDPARGQDFAIAMETAPQAPSAGMKARADLLFLPRLQSVVDELRLKHQAGQPVSDETTQAIDSALGSWLKANGHIDGAWAGRMADFRNWLHHTLAALAPLPAGLAEGFLAHYDQKLSYQLQMTEAEVIFDQQVKAWGAAEARLVQNLNRFSKTGDVQAFEKAVWRDLQSCFSGEIDHLLRNVHLQQMPSIRPLQAKVENAVAHALQKVTQPEAAEAALRQVASQFVQEVYSSNLSEAAAPSVAGFKQVLQAPDVQSLREQLEAFVCKRLMPRLTLGRSWDFDHQYAPLQHALEQAIEISGAQEIAPAARAALRQVLEKIDFQFPPPH